MHAILSKILDEMNSVTVKKLSDVSVVLIVGR